MEILELLEQPTNPLALVSLLLAKIQTNIQKVHTPTRTH